MDNSHTASYEAGKAHGQTQEKGNQLMDKASNAAQSAVGSLQQAGQTVQTKALEATEAVKNATGMNKK